MNETNEAPVTIAASTPKLNAALAKVQCELPRITKDEKADIKGEKNGRPFSIKYNFADLTAISDAVLPLLGRNGLAFSSRPTLVDGKFVLVYNLLHESGEQLDGIFPLASSGKPQDLGGLITYYRRYALCAVTGVAPGGEDNDAATANYEQQYDAPRRESFRDAAPRSQPAAPDEDDGDNGDWLDGITSQAAADKADEALRKAYTSGAIGAAKAHRIRDAIQGRARELAVNAGPAKPAALDEQAAEFAAAAIAATTLTELKAAHDAALAARKLTASFMHEGEAVTLQSYIGVKRRDLESRQGEMAGASA
jgi:hypothetical protein